MEYARKITYPEIDRGVMAIPIIIKTDKNLLPSLPKLNALALKYIFDKFHLSTAEERILDEGIQKWSRLTNLSPYERKELKVVVDILIKDKDGRFSKEKFAYKKAGIDYRRVYSAGI